MKTIIRIVILAAALVGAAFAANTKAPPVAKVIVTPGGALYIDGQKIDDRSVHRLTALLMPIKENGGRIWYYCGAPPTDLRGATNENIHLRAKEITNLALAMKIPIKRFSKEDFSEYIGLDGKTHKSG